LSAGWAGMAAGFAGAGLGAAGFAASGFAAAGFDSARLAERSGWAVRSGLAVLMRGAVAAGVDSARLLPIPC